MLEKFKAAFLVSAFLAISFAFANPTHAQGVGLASTLNLSPFWKWKQIETEHFRITFPTELADTAQRAANNLEEAHAVLSKQLYWETDRKAQVLLIDNLDAANGLTSPVERFGMALYVTPPDNWFSTAYYDDWLRLLCFHEYTHYLNMDATRGFWETGRTLFGDVLLPNAAWPSWMLEGLAVYNETRFTHAGRGRSPYYEMILRSAVEKGVLDTSKGFTLDRINSLNVPYYPAGEAVYLYGYKLMYEVAKDNVAGQSADEKDALKSGEDALGIMSMRSSDRVPYFINGNLENITGRDWYEYWHTFVDETRDRANQELAKIGSQPVTQPRFETRGAYQVVGSSFSPDGHYVAFTSETLDEKNSLIIRDLRTGKDDRVQEKISGAQLAFTPDSKFMVFSSLRQESEYYTYSELGVYSIDHGSVHWITSNLRARDPDVSPDGKHIAFTATQGPRTGIAEADVVFSGSSLSIKSVRWIYPGSRFDLASSPKYSPDGKTIYFSFHKNGRASEELMAVDEKTGRAKPLVENGKFNRYPAVAKNGDLYFVSNLTGVDNLYRYHDGKKPELVTNLTTGIAFPSLDSSGGIHGAIFSPTGWDLAAIDPLPHSVAPESVTIDPVPAPVPDKDSDPKNLNKKYDLTDYSVFPSVWPRAWIPYLGIAPDNVSIGEMLSGYDATDRHRYAVGLGYDSISADVAWLAEYQNRTLGPTLTFAASNQLTSINYFNGSLFRYTRDTVFTAAASYPFLWTFSSLTPQIAVNLDKTYYKYPNYDTATVNYDYSTQFLPTLDFTLAHSNAERSKLAISPEEGRDLLVGGRYYINNENGTEAIKWLASDREYWRLGSSHVVFVPSVNASYTSANPWTNANFNSDVVLQGHLPTIFSPFPSPSLTSLPIRGYPGYTYYVKSAVTSALDIRFPLLDVFRGWGTNPLFLDQISGFVFGEATYFPDGTYFVQPFAEPKTLPSAGGGLVANLEAFIDIPVTLTTEYHYGFNGEAGGAGELFATVAYTGFAF